MFYALFASPESFEGLERFSDLAHLSRFRTDGGHDAPSAEPGVAEDGVIDFDERPVSRLLFSSYLCH